MKINLRNLKPTSSEDMEKQRAAQRTEKPNNDMSYEEAMLEDEKPTAEELKGAE